MTERATTHRLEKVSWETVKRHVRAISQICSAFISDLALSPEQQETLGWSCIPAQQNHSRKNKEESSTALFSTYTWHVNQETIRPEQVDGVKGPNGEKLQAQIYFGCTDQPLQRIHVKGSSRLVSFDILFIHDTPSPIFKFSYQKDSASFNFEQNANHTTLTTDSEPQANFNFQEAMLSMTPELGNICQALAKVARSS